MRTKKILVLVLFLALFWRRFGPITLKLPGHLHGTIQIISQDRARVRQAPWKTCARDPKLKSLTNTSHSLQEPEIKIGLVICTIGVWLMCSSTILVRAKALLLERESDAQWVRTVV